MKKRNSVYQNKMIKYTNPMEYAPSGRSFKSAKKSMAMPGQAYSLEKVIERLRQGLPVTVLGYGYNPDGFRPLDDLTDLDTFKRLVRDKTDKLQDKIDKAKKDALERSEKKDD